MPFPKVKSHELASSPECSPELFEVPFFLRMEVFREHPKDLI
jgi:hypothetical protein